MNEELKRKLEAGLQAVGLDKGLSAIINIDKEEEVQGAIDNLLKLKTPQLSVEDMLKEAKVQSEIDRRISEAKKKWDESNKPNPQPNPSNGNLTPEAIAKLVQDAVTAATEPLTGKLGEFEKAKARDAKLSQARKALESSKIPVKNRDFYLELYNPDSETPLEEWVKMSESKHENYVQSLADSTQLAGQSPKFIDNVEPSPEDLDAMLDKMGK